MHQLFMYSGDSQYQYDVDCQATDFAPRLCHKYLAVVCLVAVLHAPSIAAFDEIVSTEHAVQINGNRLSYTAHAGRIPIRLNETGELRGHYFFTYYRAERTESSKSRPLTFVWNGGPGANSALVHFMGFGPIRLGGEPVPKAGEAAERFLPNSASWLPFSDLVFVDPVGTGYGRPFKSQFCEDFYGVREDIAATAEFIRVFLLRFDEWDSPLFLAGQSYGTWRASGVADKLLQQGIPVHGTILLSGGIPVGTVEAEPMRVALLLAARTAAAFHHQRLPVAVTGKLDQALQQSNKWAVSVYAPSLARRDQLTTAERDELVNGLARYTGLQVNQINRESLVINRAEFGQKLLADRQQVLDTFDSRRLQGHDYWTAEQRQAIVSHFRAKLKYKTDLPYQGIETGYKSVLKPQSSVGRLWKYNHFDPQQINQPKMTIGDGPPGSRPDWLALAFKRNPALKVFVGTGHFDPFNSAALNQHLIEQMPTQLQANFTNKAYAAGHVLYYDRGVASQLADDIGIFFRGAIQTDQSATSSTNDLKDSIDPNRMDAPGTTVKTNHEMQISGDQIAFTATAGQIPIQDESTGQVQGNMFFVSYHSTVEDTGTRPVTFVWNGGPGSNSGLLHMTALGPYRMTMDTNYPDAQNSNQHPLLLNESSWLPFTDLVFVDPVGTGYSRPAPAVDGAQFYDSTGDVASIAEFIRVYMNRLQTPSRPVLIAGESFGARRAAHVALTMQNHWQDINGVILISGESGLHTLSPAERSAFQLPSLFETAKYHERLAPEQDGVSRDEVFEWCVKDYLPWLQSENKQETEQRHAIANQLTAWTGLSTDLLIEKELVLTPALFSENAIANQIVSRYDSRMKRSKFADEKIFDPRLDAALSPLENWVGGNSPAVMRFFRRKLNFANDLLYIGPFGGAWPEAMRFRGDWMAVRWKFGEQPPAPMAGRARA